MKIRLYIVLLVIINLLTSAASTVLFIQAEDEDDFNIKKTGKTWDSKEEKNPRWRPGYTGEGDWYLSHGGDSIAYSIYIPESDTYHLWIRDFSDEYHRIGSRAVYFIVNNTRYGPINENPERKGFKWNYALSLDIKKGSYIVKIVKARTTSAAAIIDAFILTNNKNYLPDEQNIGDQGDSIPTELDIDDQIDREINREIKKHTDVLNLPDDIDIPEEKKIRFICLETKIRTYRLKKVLDIISDTLSKVKAETGYDPVKLDSASVKKKIEDYENKICNSEDVETAKDLVGELRRYIYGPDCVYRIRLLESEIREYFTGVAKKLRSDALRYVEKRKKEVKADIERKVHSLVKEKRAAAEQRLKDRIKKEIAKKKDDAKAKAMQKVMKGEKMDIDKISKEIRKKIEKYIEQEKKKAEAVVRAEIDEYIKNERIKVENKIRKDVEKYVNERKAKLLRAKSLFEEMAKKLEKYRKYDRDLVESENPDLTEEEKELKADIIRKEIKSIKADIIRKEIKSRLTHIYEELERYKKDIELARENDIDIDSYETIVMKIEKDAEKLTDIILSGDKRKIDREIKRFELKWKNYRNELLETYNPRKILCGKYLEQIKSAKILVKTADDDLNKILKTCRDDPNIDTCQKYRIHIKPSRDAVSNFCLKYEGDLPDRGVSWCKTLIEDIDTLDENKIPSFNYLGEIRQQLIYVNKSLEIAEDGCNSDISNKELIQRFKNAELEYKRIVRLLESFKTKVEQNEQIEIEFISEPPKYILADTAAEFNIIVGDNNKKVENIKNLVLLFMDKELTSINIDCRFHKSKWKCQCGFPLTGNNITRYKIFAKIITDNGFSIFDTGRKIAVISPDVAVADVHMSGTVFKDGETLTIWREKYSEIPIKIAIYSSMTGSEVFEDELLGKTMEIYLREGDTYNYSDNKLYLIPGIYRLSIIPLSEYDNVIDYREFYFNTAEEGV